MTWPLIKLKRVAITVAGGTPAVSEPAFWADDDEGLAWVSIGDMSERKTVVTTERRVTDSGISAARLPIGETGTLLLSMYASLGHTAFLDTPASWNQAILGIFPTPLHDHRFLKYSLDALKPHLGEFARSNTQANLNAEQVGNLEIPCPPLEEQRRIADFLDAETARIDKIQESATRQTNLLKIRRRAFIESLVNGVAVEPEKIALRFILRPSFDSGRPELQILSVYRDYGVIPKNSRQDNFNKTPDDVGRYLVVRRGDLVVNKMKAWQGSLGVSMHEGTVSPDYLVARITAAAIDREFLHYLLRSPRFTAEYAVRSKGIRPSQWRLYWEDLAQVKIPVVPLQKQVEVVSRLKHEDAWVERSLSAIHKRLDLLAERRQALITAAVTGQIDVTTASGRGIED